MTGSLVIRITTVAVADYWGRAALKMEQLDYDDVETILLEVAVGEGPECKDITDCSPTYNRY
jgi:hypothetical protein